MVKAIHLHTYNLKKDFVDKFTKLSKIGFSNECFVADFLEYSSTTARV